MKFLEPSFYTVRLPLRINAIHINITYSCVINYNYKGGIFVVFPINNVNIDVSSPLLEGIFICKSVS